jgi:hypothetical protein
MHVNGRAGASFAVAVAAALMLGGCASSGVTTGSIAAAEPAITPIQDTPVQTANLPEIGADGAIQVADSGDAMLGQPVPLDATGQGTGVSGQPTTVASAGANASFVSLDSVGDIPATPGRDLGGGLTIEKLLGGWTIVSGADQCKLNLTYTAKSGTDRYRASSPNCALTNLSVVASWQLVGNQVQLYDEGGNIIASLILSGNRFIGTLSGGQGISMVG